MDSVVATTRAIEAIMRLRVRHGTIAFHQSGGGCDGSGPMCLAEADLPSGIDDIQLGEIGGVPFLIDRDQYEDWGRPDFFVDVVPGATGGLSLEVRDGVHFTSRVRAAATDEDERS